MQPGLDSSKKSGILEPGAEDKIIVKYVKFS